MQKTFIILLIALATCPIKAIELVDLVEKHLSCCYIEDKNRNNILGVIKIDEKLLDLQISAHFDTNLSVMNICKNGELANYLPNSISINDTQLIVGKSLNGIDITQFIPQKIFGLEEEGVKTIVLEMYNVSFTSIGGGYTYIIVKLNKWNEIHSYKIYEHTKEPIEAELLEKIIKDI